MNKVIKSDEDHIDWLLQLKCDDETKNQTKRQTLDLGGLGICQSLFKRELHGSRPNFGPKLPERLKIPLDEIVDKFTLEAGHVFLGWTNCGRYLMSYTLKIDSLSEESWSEISNFYKLHFWKFIPYARAKRISSITLFNDLGVRDNNLLIKVASWPNSNQILIVGQNDSLRRHNNNINTANTGEIYVTLTTLPEISKCSKCRYTLEIDDEFGVLHESCYLNRINCLDHGFCIHLSYEHVSPFPVFNPNLSLANNNSIYFNTGNVLHYFSSFLNAQLPAAATNSKTKTKKEIKKKLKCKIWFKNSPNTEETTTTISTPSNSLLSLDSILSLWPPEPSPITLGNRLYRRHSQSSIDSDNFSLISSISELSNITSTTVSTTNTEDLPNSLVKTNTSSSIKNIKMPPPVEERKFFKRRSKVSSGSNASRNSDSSSSNSVFDIFEIHGEEEIINERNFSTFRKRKLAEKKYKFEPSDENIVPIKLRKSKRCTAYSNSLLSIHESSTHTHGHSHGSHTHGLVMGSPRSSSMIASSPQMSPSSVSNDQELILRPLNINLYNNMNMMNTNSGLRITSPLITTNFDQFDIDLICANNKNIFNPCVKEEELLTFKSTSWTFNPPNFEIDIDCVTKIERFFTEMENYPSICHLRQQQQQQDDGILLDDEESQLHKISVHGAAYKKMLEIYPKDINTNSNQKIKILQKTLDIEILINEVGEKICSSLDKSFCSCIDYDFDIFNINSSKNCEINEDCGGSVRLLIAMILEASCVKENNIPSDISYNNKRFRYSTSFAVEFFPSDSICNVLFNGEFTQIENTLSENTDIYQPVQRISDNLREKSNTLNNSDTVRILSNELVAKKSKSLNELIDPSGLIHIVRSRQDSTIENNWNF